MHYNIAEILLKLALSTNQSINDAITRGLYKKNSIVTVWIVLTHESKLYENMKIVFGFGD